MVKNSFRNLSKEMVGLLEILYTTMMCQWQYVPVVLLCPSQLTG